MLCAGNVSPDSGRSWGAPFQSSRCAGATAAGTGRPVSAAPGPPRAAPLPSPARVPPGTPAPRAPRPARCPDSRSGPTEAVRRRDAPTRRALTSFSATSRISTCNNKAGTAEPRAPGRGPAAAAAALPHARGRPPRRARPATRAAYLSRLLTGSIFQEPGDEEVELCAGERDGETRAERPRGAGARGRVRPARQPRSARLTRSQLREAFPLTRHVCGSLRGRRRDSPPPRGSGDGAAACPVAVSVCSRAEPRLHHSSNGGGGGGGGGGGNNNSQAAAPAAAASAGIPPPQKGVRAFRGPLSPPPPHAGKGVPRPRPSARADTPPRGPGRELFLYWQPEKMPEPKRRAAWQALSLRRPPAGGRKGGREGGGRHGCAEGSDAHGAAAQALFSGAGWAEMEVSFYVAEIGNK